MLLSRRVCLPGSDSGVLAVVPGQISGDSVHHTFLYLPDELSGQPPLGRGMNAATLQQFLTSLGGISEALLSIGEKLMHEHHAELGKNGNYYLQTLRDRLKRHDRVVEQLARVVNVLEDIETAETFDDVIDLG